MRAYHFLNEDMSSVFDNKPWTVGETRHISGTIIPCRWGYHGSPTLFDALPYAPGSVACVVELEGDITADGNPIDKYAARSRTLLAAVNIERELRLFAADCAERVLYIWETAYPDDQRPRLAIQAVRDLVDGRITEGAAGAAWDAWVAGAAGDAGAAGAAGQRARFAIITQQIFGGVPA